MNKNIIIVLVGGFLIAGMVAMLVSAMMGGGKKEAAPLDTNRIQILVAAKDLKVGHELVAGDMKWKDWPADAGFMGAIVRDGEQPALEAAQGKLMRGIVKDQPMHVSLVVEDDAGAFLSANVTKGMRAVGIPVSSHVLADRLIRPGDYVDVMTTYRVRVSTRDNPAAQALVNRYATETVLENIRVLAIDKDDVKAVDAAEEEGKSKKKKSARKAILTLEVTPEGAEKLLLAVKMGSIGLALRGIGDTVDPDNDQATTDVRLSKVMTELSTMTGTSSGIRIYNGATMNEVQARNPKSASGLQFDVEDAPLPAQNIYVTPDGLPNLPVQEE